MRIGNRFASGFRSMIVDPGCVWSFRFTFRFTQRRTSPRVRASDEARGDRRASTESDSAREWRCVRAEAVCVCDSDSARLALQTSALVSLNDCRVQRVSCHVCAVRCRGPCEDPRLRCTRNFVRRFEDRSQESSKVKAKTPNRAVVSAPRHDPERGGRVIAYCKSCKWKVLER